MKSSSAQAFRDIVTIRNPRRFNAGAIAVERAPVGGKLEYKPNIAHLGGDELLLLCYLNDVEQGLPTYLYRSFDGGQTWKGGRSQTELPDGGEPYLSQLRNGTLLVTGGPWGYRSEDGGRSWQKYSLPSEYDAQIRGNISRNILQLRDGSLLQIVDVPRSQQSERMPQRGDELVVRSYDGGKSWPECYRTHLEGVPDGYPWSVFAETVLWQARSGKLHSLARVDHRFYPLLGRTLTAQELGNAAVTLLHYSEPPAQDIAESSFDQFNRLKAFTSNDLGRTWQPGADLGDYGRMFHSILRLADGRLLFTYTQRSIDPPLGVRALLGRETDDGVAFDFDHDVIMLDTRTPIGRCSGGGFGNTVELDDGTMVTSYSYWKPEVGPSDPPIPPKLFNCEVVRWHMPEQACAGTSAE